MYEVAVKKILWITLFGAAGAAALGFVCFLFGDAVLYHLVFDRAGWYDRGGSLLIQVIATIGAILGGATYFHTTIWCPACGN